jgi:hypothetical protein
MNKHIHKYVLLTESKYYDSSSRGSDHWKYVRSSIYLLIFLCILDYLLLYFYIHHSQCLQLPKLALERDTNLTNLLNYVCMYLTSM